jgi:hypothetical protein
VVAATPLVIVAVLGASVEVTVTLLDGCENVELVLRLEWPDAVTTSTNPATFSPTVAVKVHVALPSGAIGDGGQPTLVGVMPLLPAAQAENTRVPLEFSKLSSKIVPYAVSQTWSTTTLLLGTLEVLVMETV